MQNKRLFMTISVFLALGLSTLAMPAQSNLPGFKMPSGNIACMAYEKILRCDISQNEAPIPPKPSDCELDWGNAFTMGLKNKPYRLCHGDTVMDPGLPILAYGKTWKQDGFICKSKQDGLTCVNAAKKGWFINRISQKLF
jgi:hypothetical protein